MLIRHKTDPSWVSFIAGALSASLVWSLGWAARQFLFAHETQLKLDRGDADDSASDKSDKTNNSSQRRPSSNRWPWDKLRDKMINVSVSFLYTHVGDESDTSVSAEEKTGPCIGEIFGMDVGGTLTKLVYFEQQIEEVKRQETHEGLHRREHYNVAASALEVLQARFVASQIRTPTQGEKQSFVGRPKNVPT